MTDRTAPEADEVEVSIFGPGKGESICVHLGAGQWIIVDSCVDQRSGDIPVLSYLGGLGVDLSTDVRLVVGTHAHDDHIAGLARVLEACSQAVFVCSAALTKEEFLRHVRDDAIFGVRESIRAEYRAIFQQIKSRPSAKRAYGVKYAVAELPLDGRPGSSDAPSASVTALSPSHQAITRAIEKLAQDVAQPGNGRRPGKTDPNELAVALFIVVGDIAILLGADLLKGPTGCGWQAVLETFTPNPLASLFKVPHHGSPNAHHDDVWTQLLVDEVISVLAPFRAGARPLPAPADVLRLKLLSKAVYSSANPKSPNPSKGVKQTRAALRDLAVDVRSWGFAGQVRARRVIGAERWKVELFHPALQL